MAKYQLPQIDAIGIRALLERNAAEHPEEVFVTFEDGSSWTRREALSAAYGAAATFHAAGVRRDDRVALLMGNGADYLRAWWGAAVLGAVVVPVNTSYRGAILAHLLRLSRPMALVYDPALADRLDGVDEPGLVPELRLAPDDLDLQGPPPELDRPIALWDEAALVLTSGTTGPSKLSITSNLHLYLGGAHVAVGHGCDASDVYQIDLPLFHIGMMYQVAPCLATRTRLAIRSRPDLGAYWEVARDNGATVGMLLSTMVPHLLNQAPRAADRQHRLRVMLAAPLPKDVEAFQARFGVEQLHAAYGSTEAPAPVIRHPDDALVPGYVGRVAPGFEVRIVDEHDIEVPRGVVGEAVVRSEQPWMLSAGYVENPAATAAAWRNGWFHTGDAMICDAEGRFTFVDRLKDAVRRRGENISSFEVESVVAGHSAVAEAACTPYREADAVEDEVKVWVVPAPGQQVDEAELLRWCVERMPHFMVPRYFEVVEALPKTPSARVQKHLLTARGNGAGTWDREEHGYRVTRKGLEDPTRSPSRAT